MRLHQLIPLALLVTLASALSRDTEDAESAVADLTEEVKARAFQHIDEQASRLRARGLETTCTREKLVFRKE